MSTALAPRLQRSRPELQDRWLFAQALLAAFCVFMVALRLPLGGGLVGADPLAWVLLPLWLPVLRRYRGAPTFVLVSLLAIMCSWFLTSFAGVDHQTSMKLNTEIARLLLSTACSVGLLLWARELLSMRLVYACFAIGLLVAGPDNHKLFATNPWKFGYSVPLTILVVGWLAGSRRPRLTVAALLGFAGVCAVADARSNMTVLLLSLVLVGWYGLPFMRRRGTTAAGVIVRLLVLTVGLYYIVQAAILHGLLGAATAARSQAQIDASGSLLVGGRPELGASTALFGARPLGFGGGTYLNSQELLTAKAGMLRLGYQPDNGYVEHFMFGRGIEVHSSVFDLWAWCGLAGLLVAATIAVLVLHALGTALTTDPAAGAVTLFAAILTLWNLPFSPWLASMPITILVLGTGLVRCVPAGPSSHHLAVPRRGSLGPRSRP